MSGELIRLALVIGNSRLHWALVSAEKVLCTWDSDHLDQKAIASLIPHRNDLGTLLSLSAHSLRSFQPPIAPLLLASVVPTQTHLWQQHVQTQTITLDQIPLQGIYPTMGIDRALAALGAGQCYGFPVLIIDGGTALTFTGVDGNRQIVGGAILPGLRLQGRSLTQHTAALPDIDFSEETATQDSTVVRWATKTPEAIRSGIFYTVIAGIRDFIEHWQQQYSESSIVFTGGDGQFLLSRLQKSHSHLTSGAIFNAALVFEGIRAVITQIPI